MVKINEHFLTYFPKDKDKKLKYLDEVWEILKISYEGIGGLHLKSKEELLDDRYIWKLCKRGDEISAVSIYKGPVGRKLIAGGARKTPQGKSDFYMILQEDLTQKDRHTWGEVSDAVEHIMIVKKGAIPFTNDEAERILNKVGKTIVSKDPDGFHYTRNIRGIPHKKIMLGNLPEELQGLDSKGGKE